VPHQFLPTFYQDNWSLSKSSPRTVQAVATWKLRQSPEANAAGLAELERELQELCGGKKPKQQLQQEHKQQ